MEKEGDERREAALASTKLLQPNFNPKRLTKHQLSKFQELHRRRLLIKSRSETKVHDTSKDTKVKGKVGGKELDSKDQDDRDSCTQVEDLSSINLRGFNNNSSTFVEQDNVGANLAPKKRQKLHWGLDTKERWERKANM